jgi:two-component system cell cycle response regulator DivK
MPANSSSKKPLLLLVEDHADTREMYGAYMKFAGFRVISAMTAEQAIELAFAEHPAVIVMDVALPMMTGTEAVRRLKANPASASIPVLLLSGHAMPTERNAGLAAGANRYVAKPCLPNELVEHIRSLLTVAPSQGPPTTKDAA